MDHLILNNGSDGAALAEVALKALREARNSKTSSSGSIFVSDGQTDDDGIALGTGTIINGVDGGIQPWVGDTTPPGKPTGITAESHNGAIWVSWDGTLEGGIPADFDHVQFTAADGSQTVDMGQLRAAGKVTAAELTAGDTAVVTAVAFDDAHDENGNSTPNASPISDAVTVIVQSAVDAGEVEKAQSDAQEALNQAGQAITTSNDAKNAAQAAKDGNVTGYSQQYAQNGDPNAAPTTGWSDTAPSWVDGKYIWVRTVVTHGDGTTDTTDPIVVTGNNGAKGDTGAQGATGATGATGVSVSSITPYWAIASSAPAKPTTDTPPSPWSATEPAYNVGQNLYRTEKVLYSDSSFAYTIVQLDSTYQYAALAKTTADGKNKIFSSASEPSHAGIVPGDLWFQLDSNKNVTGIQVWNGSAFTDMVLLGNKLLVASSVGTTQIADNAIVTGKIAANAITAIKIAAQSITGDKLDVGSVAAAIVTSGLFQTATSGSRVVIDSNGIRAIDNSEVTTVNIPSDGGTPMFTGGFQTGNSGNRVRIATEGEDGGVLQLLEGTDEIGALRIGLDENNEPYVYLGAGVDGLQIYSSMDADPLQPNIRLASTLSTVISAGRGVNVNGTWFADYLSLLPTDPRQVGGMGTIGFAGGVRYSYDGVGSWNPYDTTVVSTNLTDFFTPASGWSEMYPEECAFIVSDGMAHMTFSLKGTLPKDTYTAVGTLKAGYRPIRTFRTCGPIAGGYTYGGWTTTAGVVNIGNRTGANRTWFAVDCTFQLA